MADKVIQVPSGEVVSFPGDMPDDEINRQLTDKFHPDYLKQIKDQEAATGYEQGAWGTQIPITPKTQAINTTGADVLKQMVAGPYRGAQQLAGTVGDIREAIGAGASALGNKLGFEQPSKATLSSLVTGTTVPPPKPAPEKSTLQKIAEGIQASGVTGGLGGVLSKLALNAPTSAQIKGAMPELPKPETKPGEYAGTIGEFAPGALLGPEAAAGRVATSLGRYALFPGAASQAAGDVTKGTWAETPARIGAGLLGSAVGARVITPHNVLPQNVADAATLRAAGVTPTAGQIVSRGEKPSWLSYWEGDLDPNVTHDQRQRFTNAAFNVVGDPNPGKLQGQGQAIDRMFTRIGNGYDQILRRNLFFSDPDLANDLNRIHTQYVGPPGRSIYAPATTAAVDGALARVGDALHSTGGRLLGSEYQELRSNLSRAARGTQDPSHREALNDIVNSLDDAMERSLAATRSPDVGQFPQLRRQYRNALVLENAASRAGAATAHDVISPENLAAAAKDVYGDRTYLRGHDDFSDFAEAGRRLMRPLPDSGTSQRNRINLMLHGLGAAAGASLSHLGGAGTEGQVLSLLLGEQVAPMFEPALRPAMRGALMSRPVQRYLSNTAAFRDRPTPYLSSGTLTNPETIASPETLMIIRALENQGGGGSTLPDRPDRNAVVPAR